MILRIIRDPNTKEVIKLVPLKHIPPDQEDEFFEKNKDTGLYIKTNIQTVYPDCLKYDEVNNRVYKDFQCINEKRKEKKLNDLNYQLRRLLQDYLLKMDWGENYSEALIEINSTLSFLERNDNKEKYPECYEYVRLLHDTIENIWFDEQTLEKKIKQARNYSELKKIDIHIFLNSAREKLENIYKNYFLPCFHNDCCSKK